MGKPWIYPTDAHECIYKIILPVFRTALYDIPASDDVLPPRLTLCPATSHDSEMPDADSLHVDYHMDPCLSQGPSGA